MSQLIQYDNMTNNFLQCIDIITVLSIFQQLPECKLFRRVILSVQTEMCMAKLIIHGVVNSDTRILDLVCS